HVSRTDAEAQLYTKGSGQAAKLSYLGHALSENRHGLVVDVELTEADGYGERDAALTMLARSVRGRATLGADRAYDTRAFVAAVRARGVTPHVVRNDRGRRSAIDARTTRHPGYGRSLRQRKRVEEVFGWLKTVGGGRKLRYVGRERNRAGLELTAAAYNLVRLARLAPVPASGGCVPPSIRRPARRPAGPAGDPEAPEPTARTPRHRPRAAPAPLGAHSSAAC
ncbi:MAG: transposase, partial [Chloroflexota bacterium]|nr:transposase [Chloroflexota bacterium]